MVKRLSAIIERDGDWFVAVCPEIDVASQGMSVEEARANLTEAVELWFETATPQEIEEQFKGEIYVTSFEVSIG